MYLYELVFVKLNNCNTVLGMSCQFSCYQTLFGAGVCNSTISAMPEKKNSGPLLTFTTLEFAHIVVAYRHLQVGRFDMQL